MKTSRPGCATPNISRKPQPNFNPPPGSSPEAAGAAKKDVAKRESAISAAIKAVAKMMPTPSTPSGQSGDAMVDRKDQTAKLKEYAK